jgi:hypothetical protein
MRQVVRIKFGSHLYGTSTPASDVDYKCVHIPTAADILLQRAHGSLAERRTKGEGEKNLAGEVEEESYSLQRYLQLCVEGQTVALDMLFAPEPLCTSAVWSTIRQNRHRLLTKKSAAFVGYCRTQANKYGIKGSRVAAARDAAQFFAEALREHGPTAKVREVADGLSALAGDHSAIIEQKINSVGHIGVFFECCNRKVAFDGTIKQAAEVFQRVHEGYGNRAKLAESNEGIDWKALSHAVRVGQEALELLQTGWITFPLPLAADILDIKLGRIPYAVVARQIEELLAEVEAAALVSELPESADLEWIDEFVKREYRAEVVRGHFGETKQRFEATVEEEFEQ